jgi:hypothetical protein
MRRIILGNLRKPSLSLRMLSFVFIVDGFLLFSLEDYKGFLKYAFHSSSAIFLRFELFVLMGDSYLLLFFFNGVILSVCFSSTDLSVLSLVGGRLRTERLIFFPSESTRFFSF